MIHPNLTEIFIAYNLNSEFAFQFQSKQKLHDELLNIINRMGSSSSSKYKKLIEEEPECWEQIIYLQLAISTISDYLTKPDFRTQFISSVFESKQKTSLIHLIGYAYEVYWEFGDDFFLGNIIENILHKIQYHNPYLRLKAVKKENKTDHENQVDDLMFAIHDTMMDLLDKHYGPEHSPSKYLNFSKPKSAFNLALKESLLSI